MEVLVLRGARADFDIKTRTGPWTSLAEKAGPSPRLAQSTRGCGSLHTAKSALFTLFSTCFSQFHRLGAVFGTKTKWKAKSNPALRRKAGAAHPLLLFEAWKLRLHSFVHHPCHHPRLAQLPFLLEACICLHVETRAFVRSAFKVIGKDTTHIFTTLSVPTFFPSTRTCQNLLLIKIG